MANKLNNQAEAEPESADFDTIMIDASNTDETPRTPGMALSDSHHGTIENTPRTLSLVPSEIPNDSLASARTSTPMEFQATNLPQPTTPNTIELERNIEDTPMADISPGKGISATAIKTGKDPPEYFKSSPAEWVQDSTLKPHEFEYVSDPQKLKDIAVFEDREGYRDV